MVEASAVAWITETDMVEVDRVMIEDLRIELMQMMENAGRQLARFVLESGSPSTAAVLAGSGGNGGGGLVAARHLANAGVDVVVATTRPVGEMATVPAHQFDIIERMGITMVESVPEVDVVIDAIIGYSLRGQPRGKSAELIEQTNAGRAIVSLDTPSGLDVTTGETPGSVVNADATVTLAAPKVGLRGASQVGDLFVADISVPPQVIERFGPAPSFGPAGLVGVATG